MYLSIAGFFAYMLFLKKVVRELNSDEVLPDRVSTAYDTLAAGVVIVEAEGYILFANRSFCKIIGKNQNEIIGQTLNEFKWKGSSSETSISDFPWTKALNGDGSVRGGHLQLTNRHGKSIPMTVNATPISQDDNSIQGVLVSFDDLSEIEASNEKLTNALEKLKVTQQEVTEQNKKLHILATRDPMTNALNRRSFFEGAESLIGDFRDTKNQLCFLMVDIDHFKSVNDTHGHGVGDKVIIFLYHCLSKHARSLDIVSRFGGEEFCMAMPNTSLQEAFEIANKIRLSVKNEHGGDYPTELKITASFGVTALNCPTSNIEGLIDEADQALYHAKENGRNQVVAWPIDDINQVSLPNNEDITEPEKVVAQRPDEEVQVPNHESLVPAKPPSISSDILSDQFESLLINDRIEQAIHRSDRYGTILAVASVDIELLQRIYDTLGPSVGKKMRDSITARMQSALRQTDSILESKKDTTAMNVTSSGYRGNVLLLTDLHDLNALNTIVRRLISDNDVPLTIEGNEYIYTAQMGISVYPRDGDNPADLLRNAHIAKSQAMSTITNEPFYYFNSSIEENTKKQLSLEAELYRSIERDELVIFFQPKACLITGDLLGFEALLRWQHPTRGLLPPNEFLPFAENSGLIIDLGQWVLKSVCKKISSWNEQGIKSVPVAINVSTEELKKTNFSKEFINTVLDSEISPNLIEIEITESASSHSLDIVKNNLTHLSDNGIQVAIDDFGTGYSSLQHLNNLPIQKLKIDKSFIGSIPEDSKSTAIVSSIITMGKTLNLAIVAEGVENIEQLQFLQDMNCDQAQGHLTGRPSNIDVSTRLYSDYSIVQRIVLENSKASSTLDQDNYHAINFSLNPAKPILAGNLEFNNLSKAS